MSGSAPYETVRAAALEILNHHSTGLSWKAGGFLGQCCVSERDLSEKQRAWLSAMLARAGLTELSEAAK